MSVTELYAKIVNNFYLFAAFVKTPYVTEVVIILDLFNGNEKLTGHCLKSVLIRSFMVLIF